MQLVISPDELRPLVRAVVCEVLDRFEGNGERLAFTESEAAGLLGVPKHTLRDERLKRRIEASVVGRKIVYTRSQILEYLSRRKWEPK